MNSFRLPPTGRVDADGDTVVVGAASVATEGLVVRRAVVAMVATLGECVGGGVWAVASCSRDVHRGSTGQ